MLDMSISVYICLYIDIYMKAPMIVIYIYVTMLLYYYDIEDERHIGMIYIYVIGEDIDMSE